MKNITLYVFDNSVILKPFLQEPGANKVEYFFALKKKFEISILVPDIFRYEYFNKLVKAMDVEKAEAAYRAFIEYQVSIVPLEEDLIKLANKLVVKYPKISFYDAAYHALAKAYKATLVTADERYYEMTKSEGHVQLLDHIKI